MFTLETLLCVLWLLHWFLVWFLVVVVIPLLLLVTLFLISCMYLHLYQLLNRIQADYNDAKVFTAEVFDCARENVCAAWNLIGKIWFGYEIHGLDNLPEVGGAVLVYYHSAIPIDVWFVIAKLLLEKNRFLHTVADRFFYKLHGFKLLWRVLGMTTGTREECFERLQEGNLIAIAPGGAREAYFSDNYNLMWKKRKGFAQVAREANVPIIPFFTRNGQEAFRTPKFGRGALQWLYEKTRGPIVPIYGGFPVKLETYIGKPIRIDESLSVEDIVLMTHTALEDLINKHQPRPGSIRRALVERIISKEKTK